MLDAPTLRISKPYCNHFMCFQDLTHLNSKKATVLTLTIYYSERKGKIIEVELINSAVPAILSIIVYKK